MGIAELLGRAGSGWGVRDVFRILSAQVHGATTYVFEYAAPVKADLRALAGPRSAKILTSGRFAVRGFAVPAAMSAKFAEPHRTVWAVTDRAGFEASATELATNATSVAPINVIVFHWEAGRTIGSARLRRVDLGQPVESVGSREIDASSPAAILEAVQEALSLPGETTVIHVRVGSLATSRRAISHIWWRR